MSGGWVPYHLRINKAIERSIFMESLIKLNAYHSINDYSYIGFGAIHMEDFKLVHSLFAISDLICIEQDESIHERQKFNRPLGCLTLEHTTSEEFIANFFPEKNVVMWLDYASPKQIGEQVREFQSILSKLNKYDVVKITLNANPNTLADQNKFKHSEREDMLKERLRILQSRLSGNMPEDVKFDMMNKQDLPKVLCSALKLASQKAIRGIGDLIFHPMTSFVYSDSNHQMLTLTGVLLEKEEVVEFSKKCGLNSWEFACKSWVEPQKIDIPDLTLRERLAIDALLPCDDAAVIIQELGVLFNANEQTSINKVNNYVKYYRHYPYFSKVVV